MSKDVANNLIDGLKLNTASDTIPKFVAAVIQPVFEVKRRIANIVRTSNATTTATVTIFTTPSDRDFYLTGISFNIIKDATCDLATGRINISVTVEGTGQTALSLGTITLTAQNISEAVTLNPPLKLDRNTAVAISSASFTVGVLNRTASIVGYNEESGNQLTV